ncbi:MAG: N-acetylmuramoyl-L-alanine amidase [Bacteroidaceae bacterium]|nr:N-acetylmuramoyl-L-alanine amidase [Bacteroidaceae bacterium]
MPPLIIIDNGHGVDTPGKRSPRWPDGTQLLEGLWTREIASRVSECLQVQGYDVRLLTPEDEDVSLPHRVRRAREWVDEHRQKGGIPAQRILVSIHANASGYYGEHVNLDAYTMDDLLLRHPPSGWEAFIHGANVNCRELGMEFYRQALDMLPERFPVRSRYGNARRGCPLRPKPAQFYMLANAPCVAILTENLFMDNPDDCRYLLSDEGKQAIVRLHYQAINDYLKKRL